MKDALRNALLDCETDLDGAMHRFSGNEELYVHCLGEFLHDGTMSDLDNALETRSWDDAFTAVHALKGLAGNMGFIPLFHSSAALVVLIRTGKTSEIDETYQELKKCYKTIVDIILRHCGTSEA